ncbi:hypothetical protein FHW58_003693 [Duganella sp. 1224]|uniref:hypothetical protein n=1 Tax=Duganella sp. 1224 TaxID=2587052 RepID=UPI0015CC6A16|nr:hypothetical protein [Duganella sp. 1224]NYE62478.1 hypothetical protein [Duganella sp. 1224]
MSDVNTTSRSVGVGIGRGGLAVGGGKTKTQGTSQTVASQKAAPPAKKPYLKPLLYIFLAMVVAGLFLTGPVLGPVVSLVWLGASIAYIIAARKHNSEVWPQLYAQWDRSFVCNRCSHTFQA